MAEKTAGTFNGAVQDNDIPPAMMQSLKDDVYLFSALKTHAQLFEASRQLLTEDGRIKPFSQFSQDIARIKTDYNRDYLEAEYQFAITSAQMAGKWAASSDRYDLQYRTAGDDRVRQSHAQLNNITLPKDDPFWLSYYPPNGWRCRCNALEVLKGKYEVSDSADAISKGETATSQVGKDGKNRLEIFRFNPGAQKVIFPPTHPYNKVQGAAKVKNIFDVNKYVPINIEEYEKELGVSIDRDIFRLLKKETKLTFINPEGINAAGSYYLHEKELVKIPLDERRKKSKWLSNAIIYHEFGHAADWQNNLKVRKDVKALMSRFESKLDFPTIDRKLKNLGFWAFEKGHFDLMNKTAAAHDTLMSLNPKYGMGHSQEYWKIKGNKEAEFLAHSFENSFTGNEVFKKYMPQLYNETIKLIEVIKTELMNQ